jgi:hypothetical protein
LKCSTLRASTRFRNTRRCARPKCVYENKLRDVVLEHIRKRATDVKRSDTWLVATHPNADIINGESAVEALRRTDQQKYAVMGKGSCELFEAGLVSWSDIVSPSRVREFHEVMDFKGLTIPQIPEEILADTPEPCELADGATAPEELKDELALRFGQPLHRAGHSFKEARVAAEDGQGLMVGRIAWPGPAAEAALLPIALPTGPPPPPSDAPFPWLRAAHGGSVR